MSQAPSFLGVRVAPPAGPSRGLVVARAQAVPIPAQFKTVTPKGDLVLLKVAPAEEKTAGGIILPDSVRKRPTAGDVVAVGDGKVEGETLEMKLQPGTTVLYGRFGIGCTDVEVNGQPHLLIREDDCIGVMPKSDVNAADIPQMQPVGTRVLVRVTEESDVTVGGVLLPSAAKEKPVMGEVVAVGWGTKDEPMELQVGDRVVYFKYAGDPLETPDGKKYVALRQNDVLCKA